MKKTTANKRKKLPLLLGALLIVSVAAYGTRAYFSDSAEQQGNIALTLGTVDIEAGEKEDWKYIPLTEGENIDENNAENVNKIEDKTDPKGIAFKNVRPGDTFTRDYVFTNTGTLDVKLGLDSELSTEGSPFVTTIKDLNEGAILEPKTSATYTVTITVDPETVNNDYNNLNKDLALEKYTVDYLDKNLTVNAVQTNADNIDDVINPVAE